MLFKIPVISMTKTGKDLIHCGMVFCPQAVFKICRHVVSPDDRNMPKSPKYLFFNVIFVTKDQF